jgi:class 3 adenylate cyclase/tetratricopeptide (TPR) repeat protein
MAKHQKESERKQATILYAGLTGFNDLSEKIEAGELTNLMNKFFQTMESVISLYGGTINKFTGEGIMATFGVTEIIEKAPSKAVSSAVELQDKISELIRDTELPLPVSIKIGIQTGAVLLGKIGPEDKARDTLIGESVSIASRICDIAENGQILTGKETYDKTKEKFDFQVLEPVPIKGRKKPLAVFEVKGRKKVPIATGVQTSRMISSTMVGREKEFKELEKQFMQLINGRGSIVNITGKAGIGKSRLMAEIRQKELVKKVAFFEGRALSNGKGFSFHPIIRIIKSWARIKEEDSTTDSITKLQRAIRRIYAEAFDEIFPFIATMMGYRLEGKAKDRLKNIEGEALENLILKNMRDLLSRAASIRPVVIVIEDAHWCDVSSIIFLESLFKLTLKNRILFVNIFRPEHKETGVRISNFLVENLKDHFLEIKIQPLLQQQSDELINNLLHQADLPDEINNLIIERAAGNPFFIEEVIRSFIDEELVEIKDQRFILTEKLNFANIPESIDKIILSRIERLDEKTKDLLKTASVIGRNFYYKVLEEAAETIGEMDSKLEYLKDVQLLNERKQKDEVEFLFKHALAQQATYDSIMEKTKKDLHLKIAGSIEKVFAGRIHEFYGMLAHHYSKAGQQEKTEEYLIKAGEESMKSGASSEAVNFLKKALETHLQNTKNIPDRQKVVDLQENLAFALYATGQFVEAVDYFDKVIAFYYKPFPKSDIRKIFDLLYNLLLGLKIINFYKSKPKGESGEIERKVLKIMESKGKALVSVDPKRLFLESFYAYRFMSKHKFGNYEASVFLSTSPCFFYSGILMKFGEKVMGFGEKYIDEKYVFGWLLGKFARCMFTYYAGKEIEIQEEEKVYQVCIQAGQIFPVTVFYAFGGFNMIESGNEKQTLYYLQRLTGIIEAFDNNYTIAQFHRLNAVFNLKFRKIEETIKITIEAHDIIQKTDHINTLLAIYCFRSMAFSFRQDYAEAGNILSEAEKLLKKFKTTWYFTYYLIAKSYIEIAELKEKTAEKNIRKNVLNTTKYLIHHSQKVRKNLTEAYRLRAIVYWLLNKPNKTLRNFDRSIKVALSFDGNLELSRTYFEIGKFLRNTKNKKESLNGMNGTEYLLKAKSMFEEMNLQWDLEEYEKYMEGNELEV